jgi:site-specific DNA-adenine methylase
MSYGKIINGGAQMRKGVSKGINDKLSTRSSENDRRETVAVAVRDAYKVNTISSQHTQNSNKGQFTKPSNRSKDIPV